jgi:hypothetical protein
VAVLGLIISINAWNQIGVAAEHAPVPDKPDKSAVTGA